ncbi:MAG TPA: ATP-binding protein [Burkholderiales bacterium]|nr:ATP-binding protein [Burkholderiales bacterium]
MKHLSRTFPAQLRAFEQVKALIDEFGEATGLGREDRHKLTLIVEELFTNTVTHGHRGDSNAPVQISLEDTAAGVQLTYEDSAPQYDPLAASRRTDIESTINERRIGGLGVLLTIGLTNGADYRFVEGHNRISFTLVPNRE